MALKKTILEPSWETKYSFSPAVITEGGKIIWLAGHVGFVDDNGASLAGNFDVQVRQAFPGSDIKSVAFLREPSSALGAPCGGADAIRAGGVKWKSRSLGRRNPRTAFRYPNYTTA